MIGVLSGFFDRTGIMVLWGGLEIPKPKPKTLTETSQNPFKEPQAAGWEE